MPRPRSAPKIDTVTKRRGVRAPVPSWWIELAERRCKREPTKDPARPGAPLNLDELGVLLAATVGRPAPWHHTLLSKFFSRHLVTGEIADAIRQTFPELPLYAYYPANAEEAMEYEVVRKGIEAKRTREAGTITHHLGVMEDAFDDAARAAVSHRGKNARQGMGVGSPLDVKKAVAGDPGKADRGGRSGRVDPHGGSTRRSRS